MQYIYIVTSRECINNLFFHVLYSRQAIFIYSIRSKAVDLFIFFFILSTLLFVGYFQSHAVGIIVCFFFFLIHKFFNNGGPLWVGIKIVMIVLVVTWMFVWTSITNPWYTLALRVSVQQCWVSLKTAAHCRE